MKITEQPGRDRHRPSHRTIGLRLYEDEIAALDRAVSGSGARSRNHLMRRLARRAGGLMDPDPAVISAWGELVVVMRGLGNNLNQIAALFRPNRHRLSARSYRHARSDAFELWTGYTADLAA